MHTPRATSRLARLAILALLPLVGCSNAAIQADPGGREAAAKFLDDLRAGQIEPAWRGTSTEFKSLMGLENLRDYVKTHPALKEPAEFVAAESIEREGQTLAECAFHATTRVRGKPKDATIKVQLTPGDDGWQVEHLAVQ